MEALDRYLVNTILFISIDKAIELAPRKSELWNYKIDLLEQLGRFDEALSK